MKINNIQKFNTFSDLQTKIIVPKNNVSFGSASSVINKFNKAIQFEGFNLSHVGLLIITYGAVMLPRYFKSRDKEEKREVLVRDLISITAIVFARRSLQNVFAKTCSKLSGFALSIKPQKHTGFLQKAYNYLRPNKGIQVLSSEQLVDKYSNIHKYKNGIMDFFKFIQKQGGDIKKVLSHDPEIKTSVIKMHKSWTPLNAAVKKSASFEQTKGSELFSMFKELHNPEKQNAQITAIENILKNPENSLIQKTKLLNSSFDFLTIFVLVPLFLGVYVTKLNEKITKDKITKEDAEKVKK